MANAGVVFSSKLTMTSPYVAVPFAVHSSQDGLKCRNITRTFGVGNRNTEARIRLSGDDKHVYVPRKAFEHRQRVTLPLFRELAKQPGVTALFAQRYMCGPKRCRVGIDSRPLYCDEHHLSVSGAHQLEPMVVGIFEGQNG